MESDQGPESSDLGASGALFIRTAAARIQGKPAKIASELPQVIREPKAEWFTD
jgi:hypothetical protein